MARRGKQAGGRSKSNSRARMLVPVACLGLLVGGLAVAISNFREPSMSVSDVRRLVNDVLDRKPYGTLGPWQVTAGSIDRATGTIYDLHIDSRDAILSAQTARLVVDPHADTVSFELFDVMITRISDDEAANAPENPFGEVDRYVLGPIEWNLPIEPDERLIADAQ